MHDALALVSRLVSLVSRLVSLSPVLHKHLIYLPIGKRYKHSIATHYNVLESLQHCRPNYVFNLITSQRAQDVSVASY